MPTQGTWEQQGSQPDLQIFIGAQRFKDLAGLATTPATIATPGLIWQLVPAGDACIFVADLTELLLRSGVFANPLWTGANANAGASQEAFGTAAAVAGPTAVANTRDALGTYPGRPPYPGANLDTITGGVNGPQPKGMQIDSVDVIYQVLADATAVAATMGLTKTTFSNLAAPVVTNLIALAANGLPVIVGAQPQVKNVLVPSPAMIVAADTQVLLNINLTGGTAGTIKFFGAVVKAHYNLN
jgi:hypothetical protein